MHGTIANSMARINRIEWIRIKQIEEDEQRNTAKLIFINESGNKVYLKDIKEFKKISLGGVQYFLKKIIIITKYFKTV